MPFPFSFENNHDTNNPLSLCAILQSKPAQSRTLRELRVKWWPRQSVCKVTGQSHQIFILRGSAQKHIFAKQEGRKAGQRASWQPVSRPSGSPASVEDFWWRPDLIVRLHKKSAAVCVRVWERDGAVGGGCRGHNPVHCLGPSPSRCRSSVRLRCPDPDHNVGGWCYRKRGTPGKIARLHGDSPVFTSSLSGCLWGDGGGGRRAGGGRGAGSGITGIFGYFYNLYIRLVETFDWNVYLILKSWPKFISQK